MLKVHPQAVEVHSAGRGHVGWLLENRDFSFHAVEHRDGRVFIDFEWGKDDKESVIKPDWEEAKKWLDRMLQASRR